MIQQLIIPDETAVVMTKRIAFATCVPISSNCASALDRAEKCRDIAEFANLAPIPIQVLTGLFGAQIRGISEPMIYGYARVVTALVLTRSRAAASASGRTSLEEALGRG
jgi:hypothetical protein